MCLNGISKDERVNSYINLNGVISLDKAIEIVVAEKNMWITRTRF